jgi:hypothetical protein
MRRRSVSQVKRYPTAVIFCPHYQPLHGAGAAGTVVRPPSYPASPRRLVLARGTGIEQRLYDIRRQVLLIRTEIRLIQSEGRNLGLQSAQTMTADLEDGELIMEFLSRSATATHLGDILELRCATRTLLDEIKSITTA